MRMLSGHLARVGMDRREIKEMAESLGASSNPLDDLFQELSDWNEQLKHADIDLEELSDD